MSELVCTCEINSVEENIDLARDILVGKGLDVLFCLLDGACKAIEISQKIGIPTYSVQLYLQRLQRGGLIEEKREYLLNGVVENVYSLASDEIEIINRIQTEQTSMSEVDRYAEISAQHFSVMTRKAIKQAVNEPDKPNKIRAYFMKTQSENMKEFKKEIDELFSKYQTLENLEEKDTYSLFTVMAPYKMEE